MKRLALLGASGHGKVIADAALLSGWDSIAFYDDAWPNRKVNGIWLVEGNSTDLMMRLGEFDGVIASIGDCDVRWKKHSELLEAGAKLVSIVHPGAVISRQCTLGAGSVVMAGAIINIDAVVGQACIINTGATVDHDCHISDGVHIGPGAHLSGHVDVGQCSWVGVGAVVRQGVKVGTRVMVGAGAVVIHPVPDTQTVVGNPARLLQTRE